MFTNNKDRKYKKGELNEDRIYHNIGSDYIYYPNI